MVNTSLQWLLNDTNLRWLPYSSYAMRFKTRLAGSIKKWSWPPTLKALFCYASHHTIQSHEVFNFFAAISGMSYDPPDILFDCLKDYSLTLLFHSCIYYSYIDWIFLLLKPSLSDSIAHRSMYLNSCSPPVFVAGVCATRNVRNESKHAYCYYLSDDMLFKM